MSVEEREISFDTRAGAKVLRHLVRRQALPGIGKTHGQWRGVATLERAKAKGLYRLPWKASLRKTSKR